MDTFDLKPDYTYNEVPGRCLKCLAEKELDTCLFSLLSDHSDDVEIQQRYEALLALLRSPDFEKLRSQAEKLLSDGKHVKVKVHYDKGNIQCELLAE